MRRLVPALVAAALLMPASASAEPRSGLTSEGVRFSVNGRTARMYVPRQIPRRVPIRLRCGHEAADGRRQARVEFRARPGRVVSLRLPRAVPDAEWCAFQTLDGGRTFGAAVLKPRAAPTPPEVAPGPGVRTGETGEDDELDGSALEGGRGTASFSLRAATVTVRLSEPFSHSSLVTVACNPSDRIGGYRTVAVWRGQRTVTVDLARDVAAEADYCLIENALVGFGDIAAATMGPPAPAV